MAVYYYLMENDMPSWGTGMIYYHVWLLQKNKIEAYALHDKAPYKLPWIDITVPLKYLNGKDFQIKKSDYLVIPEYYADTPQLIKYTCNKVVFVQNAFYIFDGLKDGKSYEDLGIEQVFYYMPHLRSALQQITRLPLYETPPFIAPYFYQEEESKKRKRRIIIYPKHNNRDYNILKRMLETKLGLKEKKAYQKLLSKSNDWEIVELKNKSHHEVAEEMHQATFFISLNTTEAFNSSVPEAMAAGCINICYEGVGPADFLINERNAFVFCNNHVYEMTEKLLELVTSFENIQDKLRAIRLAAKQTADTYRLSFLEERLLSFFKAKS